APKADLPCSPNPFAFAKAPVENIVGPDVTFRPITFAGRDVVAAFDKKAADIICSVTTEPAVREGQVQVHPVPVTRMVIIKSGPRAGRKKVFAHKRTL